MSPEQRFQLLQSSVTIISMTNDMVRDKRMAAWAWFFRDYMQWHSLAIVVAELGRSTNKQFAQTAWKALDPILATWDKTYSARKDEPAWDHVNALIERARQMRRHNLNSIQPVQPSFEPQAPNSMASSSNILARGSASMTGSLPLGDIGMNFATSSMPYAPASSISPHQALTPHSMDDLNGATMPSVPGCGPTAFDYDTDFAAWDGFDQVDFSAFDAVFGDGGWWHFSPEGTLPDFGTGYV
jgi:hypothetical protein